MRSIRLLVLCLSMASPSAFSETLHIAHCMAGCPSGTAPDNEIVVREIYAVSTNQQTQLADWVAYKVSKEGIGISTHLPREWRVEPFYEDPLDDERSTAFEQAGFTRGSFAPLNSFAATMHWRDTTLFSNLAPQKQALRLGPWFRLEQAERTLAGQLQEPIYVITGPIYRIENLSDKFPAPDLQVPSAFFKVIALADGATAAFIMPQDLQQHINHCDQLSSVAAIEQATGLDLFPRDEQFVVSDLSPRLGCWRP